MNRLFWMVLICITIDVLSIQIRITQGVDVFTPGVALVAFIIILVYTAGLTYILKKRNLLETHPITSNLLLLPVYGFLFLNLIAFLVWMIAFIK
jgi:hypothetical protein